MQAGVVQKLTWTASEEELSTRGSETSQDRGNQPPRSTVNSSLLYVCALINLLYLSYYKVVILEIRLL